MRNTQAHKTHTDTFERNIIYSEEIPYNSGFPFSPIRHTHIPYTHKHRYIHTNRDVEVHACVVRICDAVSDNVSGCCFATGLSLDGARMVNTHKIFPLFRQPPFWMWQWFNVVHSPDCAVYVLCVPSDTFRALCGWWLILELHRLYNAICSLVRSLQTGD